MKKEYKIGETFQCGHVKLKVKETKYSCKNCIFDSIYFCTGNEIVGKCSSEDREDKKEVVFVKVEE